MAEIINIFNFLKEFNELSNPVITQAMNNLPFPIYSFSP